MANQGFEKVASGYPISVSLVSELQGTLMRGTPLESVSGKVRDQQVVVGRRVGADPKWLPVHKSRFVPAPPGLQLNAGMRDLFDWMRGDLKDAIDPVVAAAMSHYQFEALH